jgi:hypothetical protein
MSNLEIRLVDEKIFPCGRGYTLWAKYRNYQTWYELETWSPSGTVTTKREYYDTDAAFNACDRLDAIHGSQA